MHATLVDYVIACQPGDGWRVLRNGSPIGRRGALIRALDFATHLAEREALRGRHTRVLMAREDTGRLPGCAVWQHAA